MSKKKNKKVSEGNENNEVEQNNKEEKCANKKGGGDDGKTDGGAGSHGNGGGGGDGGKKNGGGGEKEVVLKMDLHCEGCVSKVIKLIREFEGVINVGVEAATNKLTITGKMDPVKLQQKLEEKMHKKVEILSPLPKKGKDDAGKGKDGGAAAAGSGGGDHHQGKPEFMKKDTAEENHKNKKSDDKKDKKVPVTTSVLKVPLHCQGCIQKINKIITKTKGYQEMKLDRHKDMVTVTGSVDMKTLVASLKKHLKREVEIMPPKNDEKKDNDKDKDKDKNKDKENKKDGSTGGGGKGKGGGGGGGKDGRTDEERIDKMNMQVHLGYVHGTPYGPSGAPYGPPGYDPYQFNVHAPQYFSDENPNACSIM